MFKSGITASNLINDLKNEIDMSLPIADSSYFTWINSLEQLLYSEFIREQNRIKIKNPTAKSINISDLTVDTTENTVRFEDIYTIYADGIQLTESTVTCGDIFPNTYYKLNENIGYNTSAAVNEMTIIYFAKPALKVLNNDSEIMIPIEFIELIKSKLRGEAYKIANEDNLAAKWLNDYNMLLENFKVWLQGKQASFGM